MDSFIKKIFDSKNTETDELVHVQFQKFSRGEFKGKAMLRLKNSAGKYSLDTTYEYARELVMLLAEKLGNNKTQVTGALVAAIDLSGFKYIEKKMAMGARKYMIDMEMTGKEIIELCNTQNKAFIALSFNVGDDELKIQPKSPKSAKGASSSKGENAEEKINFCKLKTSDWGIIENFIFEQELKKVKKVEIKHIFNITDIIIPKNETDPAKMRELAKRKGNIIRIITIDGNRTQKEHDFLA
ncbi:MAG: hypothetical protein Q8L27_00300 [archaeon]|nr:hypothetical protein [archaeon]